MLSTLKMLYKEKILSIVKLIGNCKNMGIDCLKYKLTILDLNF